MRNQQVNRSFAENPTNIDISRSRFTRGSTVKTSFNVGEVVPFYVDEVLPGDTFNVTTSKVVRMQTLITPVMDDLYLDTYYFFVPNRLVWEHWKQFNGENTQSAWIPQTEYSVPQLTAPVGGWTEGTIADYFGIPTKVSGLSVNAMPFRAYALIMNEFFRDENLSDPLNIPVTDSTVVGSNGIDYINDVAKGGKPFIACKLHDYFTSCLPSPQKGPDVMVGVPGNLPVVTSTSVNSASLFPTVNANTTGNIDVIMPAIYAISKPSDVTKYCDFGAIMSQPFSSSGVDYWTGKVGAMDNLSDLHNMYTGNNCDNFNGNYVPINLVAQGSNSFSINDLRLAFQLQKLYEKDARGGTRYTEILQTHFSVHSPDSRLQRPEYLGGNRININVNQVVQTSSGVSDSPQGNTAAYSLTSDSHSDFIQSFTEHGFVIGLCVARYNHTYQQGLERFWSRKTRFEYYWPVFSNIGEQSVKNQEIYAQGNAVDSEVFGYQEAWADYRYKPSRVTGEMRSNYDQSLDVWHFGDDYAALPYLSDSWIREDKANVDRALAVKSTVANQLFGDFYIQNVTVRPMPMYSIPGLIDHH